MKKINKLFGEYMQKKCATKNPPHERALWIQKICEDIFTQKDFQKILGQTKDLSINEIQEIYDRSLGWRVNPQALFWKLLRKVKEAKTLKKK